VIESVFSPDDRTGVQIHDLRRPIRPGHFLSPGAEVDHEHRRVRVHRTFPTVRGARMDHPNVFILEQDLVRIGIHDRCMLGLLS
jgi:hypothetical protein